MVNISIQKIKYKNLTECFHNADIEHTTSLMNMNSQFSDKNMNVADALYIDDYFFAMESPLIELKLTSMQKA